MDAAEDLLRSDGIDGLTIPAVAQRSGVSVGGIYRRFQGKQDILRAVKHKLLSQHESNVRRSMNVSFKSLHDVVRRYVTTATDEMSSRGGLYTLILTNQGADPVMVKMGHELISKTSDILKSSLAPFVSEIRHEDPELAIEMVFVIILSAVNRRNVRFPSPTETMSWDIFGRELTKMTTVYLTGI